MASIQDLLAGDMGNVAVDEQTAAPATATQAAPGAGLQLIITGFSVSATNVAPAAGTYRAIIKQNVGAVTRVTYNLPAAAFAPIIYEFKRPIKVPENQNATLDIPSFGANATGRVELYTITRPVTV
jgi:hypothetical protein